MSSNIGHIGQGRPSNNSDNSNCEIHEVARKMSLLGLFATASNSGNGSPIIDISSVDTPVNASTNYPSVIQRLETPSSQGTLLHTNITNSSTETTLSQVYGRTIDESDNLNSIGEVDEKDNRFMQNNYNQNGIDSHEVSTNLQAYDDFVEVSPDLRIRHELLDCIHAFIPPGGTKLHENNLFHAQSVDKNPMISFKFDIEKIVAAL